MIEVRSLTRHYRVHKRPPGLGAALRSLVSREYSTVKAVDGITFEIKPGERVGFLGPNGAGKTTTLKILAGLLYPTSGEVRVDGHVPQRREAAYLKKIMLVMGQKQQLLWDLPPAETFELNRAVYDVPRDVFTRRMKELGDLLELGDLVNKPTRQLSLGERMKCELAAALVHGPKVLFLDEPTIGLDVSMQVVMRDFIRRYNEQTGATLILTSHYMDDVAALCPRVIVIDRGTLSYDGSLEQLVQKVRPEKRVTLHFSQPVSRAQVEPLGKLITCEAAQAVLQVAPEQVNAVVGRALASLPVVDLNVENPPLEEVMSELFSQRHAAVGAPSATSV
ncbi:MAG: ATP-binding cassette domain-containing protein [Myxococcaceae bacterium]|nr:ATP-binding cassette domain-containing protein [Myxococcaceae bacterium]